MRLSTRTTISARAMASAERAYQQMLADIEAGQGAGRRGVGLGPIAPPAHRIGALHAPLPTGASLGLATVTGEADLSTDNGRLYRPHHRCRGPCRGGAQVSPPDSGSASAGRVWQGMDAVSCIRLHRSTIRWNRHAAYRIRGARFCASFTRVCWAVAPCKGWPVT